MKIVIVKKNCQINNQMLLKINRLVNFLDSRWSREIFGFKMMCDFVSIDFCAVYQQNSYSVSVKNKNE